MKTSHSSVHTTGLRFASVVVYSVTVGAISAGAETFQHGGSTATIEQSGGSGASKSQVTHYHDGQKIVTQDGDSTDITIQRSGGSPALDDGWGYAESGDDRFDPPSIEERFWRTVPDERSADDYPEHTTSSARGEFKQRMLGRMRSRLLP